MPDPIFMLASVAGSIVGSLYDPFTWFFLAATTGMIVCYPRWWVPPILAIAFTAAHTAIAFSWWMQIGGLAQVQRSIQSVLVSKTILAFAAYGLIALVVLPLRARLTSR